MFFTRRFRSNARLKSVSARSRLSALVLSIPMPFDLNLRVKNMLPSLYREDPEFYENMRIQDLAQNAAGSALWFCRYRC
jgi:arginine/lysine/ornithine decarboxylase